MMAQQIVRRMCWPIMQTKSQSRSSQIAVCKLNAIWESVSHTSIGLHFVTPTTSGCQPICKDKQTCYPQSRGLVCHLEIFESCATASLSRNPNLTMHRLGFGQM